MQPQSSPHPSGRSQSRLFSGVRTLALASLLAALSIVLGKYAAINITDNFRLSFENLPILMAGLFAGPLVGCAVGCVADLVGCVLVGYAINPIITAGAALVGLVSGLLARYALPIRRKEGYSPWRITLSVYTAHVVGSMLVKSLGLWVYYGTPLVTLAWRIPIYLLIGAAESGLLIVLSRSRVFMGELHKITHGRAS